jgi:uncharacterized protein YkwD
MRIRPGHAALAVTVATLGTAAAPAHASHTCPDADLQPNPETVERVASTISCVINERRHASGLKGLKHNHRLRRSALRHTRDMIAYHYFAHQGETRPTLLDRVTRAKYFQGAATGLYAENLAVGPLERATARGIVDAWMQSPHHKANMLDARLTEVGVGATLTGPDPAFYPEHDAAVYTADFGRRDGVTPKRCRTRSGSGSSTSVRRPGRYCPQPGGSR